VRTGAALQEDADVRNQLECKLHMNTYRLYFVQHTEDYLYRRRAPAATTAALAHEHAPAAHARFHQWLQGPQGWSREMDAEAAAAAAAAATEGLLVRGEGATGDGGVWETNVHTDEDGRVRYTTAFAATAAGEVAPMDADA
jgi:hypothetical protein